MTRIEITSAHKEILDKELIAYLKDPKAGSSWGKVKERIKKKGQTFPKGVKKR